MESENVILEQMENTRTSLTERLETLEKRVVTPVQQVTSQVAENVGAVKETVQETVADVKEKVQGTFKTVKDSVQKSVNAAQTILDVRGHVDRHPWPMLGGAIALGYVVGGLVGKPRRTTGPGRESAARPSWGGLLSKFASEFTKVKSLALDSLIRAIREPAVNAASPDVRSSLDDLFNKLKEKLAGEPARHHPEDTERPTQVGAVGGSSSISTS